MSLGTAVSVKNFKHVGTPYSTLVHHGECCRLAKNWLHSMHRSLSFNQSERQSVHAPSWLRRKFGWGPVQWPISWCEAVKQKHIDCGVFAAFAREIFEQEHCEVYPAQILMSQPTTYINQWSLKWAAVFQHISWIGDEHVYHEVSAVVIPGTTQIRIYDPTEGLWLEPAFTSGINGVVGVNVFSPAVLDWGQMKVGQGKWVLL